MQEGRSLSRVGDNVTVTTETTVGTVVLTQVMTATVIDGVTRWDSNNQVPPADVLDEMLAEGVLTVDEHARSSTQRSIEQAALIAKVKARANGPSIFDL